MKQQSNTCKKLKKYKYKKKVVLIPSVVSTHHQRRWNFTERDGGLVVNS